MLKFFSGLQPRLQARQALFLGHLAPAKGATHEYKRLGRGPASGKGKTAGRGQKGQKARGKVPRLFEGGQTPYFKRFPIVGFKRPHRKEYAPLNLARIQDFWNHGRIPLAAGQTLDIRGMRACGLVTGSVRDGVQLLGNGKEDFSVPLNIEASRATSGAIGAIEAAGHTFTAVYHTKLGLMAHLKPEWFLRRRGRVPLQARPVHKRDVDYYLSPAHRGFLQLAPLQATGAAPRAGKEKRRGTLGRQLEAASTARFGEYTQLRVVALEQL